MAPAHLQSQPERAPQKRRAIHRNRRTQRSSEPNLKPRSGIDALRPLLQIREIKHYYSQNYQGIHDESPFSVAPHFSRRFWLTSSPPIQPNLGTSDVCDCIMPFPPGIGIKSFTKTSFFLGKRLWEMRAKRDKTLHTQWEGKHILGVFFLSWFDRSVLI